MSYGDLSAAVLCYLTANFMEPIDMGRLEAHVGASRFTMTRAFKQVYGVPPLRFLWTYRVMMASRLLIARTRLSSDEIAHTCGFQTLPHFYRVFKRVTGHTPRDVREFARSDVWLIGFQRRLALPRWRDGSGAATASSPMTSS
jgi:AraC-like DNA-binding protein